jgi:hypothetical protein
MSRPVIVFVAVVLLIACASAQPFQSKNDADHDNFAVSSVGDSAVLIDTQTGQSWLLQHPVSEYMPSVWIPMKRLDSKEEVLRWRAEQAEQAAIQDETVK